MQNGRTKSTQNGFGETDIYKKVAEKFNGKVYQTLSDYLRDAIAGLGEDQSFYTLDLADVLWKVQLWKEKMHGIHPYYAVKTNSDPVLLRLLVSLGFSFDCSTKGEIKMALKAGADPKNIVFAHVIKSACALRYADSVGVNLMTFDCEEELDKIQTYHPKSKLLLRLAPESVKCSFDLSNKFGCEFEEAESILSRAKDLNLDVVGVSFHVGGLCKTPESYSATICAAGKVFSIAQKLGFKCHILDIGGGFTGDKGTEEIFDEMAEAINLSVKNHFTDEIEIIAEPGTFFVGSAAILTTSIFGKKKRRNTSKNGTNKSENDVERYYYLNDSIYGSFFVGIEEYGSKLRPLLEESDLKQRAVYKSTLWGQSCSGDDFLVQECMLPDMEDGEFIVWENMGAYCRVLCSTFCGAPIPLTKYVFIKNDRLKGYWMNNIEEVTSFISRECCLIEKE